MKNILKYLAILVLWTMPMSGYCQSKPIQFDANALMLLLARHPAGEARFVETKHLALLAQPLVSKGHLRYTPPDKLLIVTEEPRPETLSVDGDWISHTAEGKTRRMQIATSPEAAGIVEGIRGSLSGNRTALDTHFHLEVSGTAAQWRMVLTPRDSRVAQRVARIVVEGRQNLVTRITTQQGDGDRSVMDIAPR